LGAPAHPLLELTHLKVVIPQARGDIHAVRDVSLKLAEGERVVILGESGCGKTMTAMSLLGLQPPEAQVSGAVTFRGTTATLGGHGKGADLVLRDAGVVFQDSLSSLNPTLRIGEQLIERLTLRAWKKADAFAEAVRVLGRVGVPDPKARMQAFPHELSGGMRQRVIITMALLAKPALLVADEPTTALDTTVQAQVIDLIRTVQSETRMGLLLITHDLAMAAEVCDRAIVMYAGYVVEDGPIAELLRAPRHPYTRALLKAMPRLDTPRESLLEAIDGEPPSAREIFGTCPFIPRCPEANGACAEKLPVLETIGAGRTVRCVHHLRLAAGSEAGA
jgi:oligopeptide/dipeptide ABC transporter ATP-binding protein